MASIDSDTDEKLFVDLTGFQRDLLGVLAREGQTYGLGVKRDLEEMYRQEINHGRLYPNLDMLVERGLVEKGEIDDRTNSYELTAGGREELAAYRSWLADCLATDGG